MEIGIILILFANIGFISTADWQSPPFTKPDDFNCTTSVNYDATCNNWIWDNGINTVFIKFEEGLEKPILISHIHCTDCAAGPKIGSFSTGSRSLLDPEIKEEEEAGKYALIIKNKLDYEIEEQRIFKFNLELDGAKKKLIVQIDVQDIDNKPPRITVNQIPCNIPENYAGKTNCTYTIFDPDTVSDMKKLTFKFPDELKLIFNMELTETKPHYAEASLYVNKDHELDFETMPLYYFEIEAKDAAGNPGTAQIMIKVKDVNDQPPVWIDIFAMQSFEENIDQRFMVSAKDGDLEVNDVINFELDCGIFNQNITIETSTNNPNEKYVAYIIVSEIDRDVPEVENLDNTIKCTIIATDPIFNATANISFIIQDQNDNKPIITLDPKQQYPLILREEEFATLDKIFSIMDIDQGNNAQFDVTLENKEGNIIKIDYTEPFQVIPNNGYRNWDFSISVVPKPKELDYDRTEDWREFSLKIRSKDKGEEPQLCEKIIDIELKNLNDEIPTFDQSIVYEMSIEENATQNAYIFNVFAEDVDVGDYVTYTLSNGGKDYKTERNQNDSITIYTSRDNVFDYEKIKIVYVQISATDNLTIPGEKDNFHTVTQQLKINVLDVNDEKPRLTLPYETPNIDEHSDVGITVTSSITAEDVDTTAYLKFTIEWDKCRASKLGVPVENKIFKDVFIINTEFPDKEQTGQATGVLKVNNNFTLDYEEFDTIFLNIQVEDLNQTIGIGTDEGIMTILINDINDNPPLFNNKTLTSIKTVTEHSKSEVKIATIIATDIDGPGNNEISYFIEPINNTKSGLIKINNETGELTVDGNEKIDADRDADNPEYTDYLYYEVTASDIVHNTTAKIEIKVEDINNKKPFLQVPLLNNYTIEETTSNKIQHIQIISGFDYDRDDPHSNVTYYLNNEITPLSNKYKIDAITGDVWAVGIIEWTMNHKQETIYAYLEDNFQQRDPNIEKVNFTVTILDVDNMPPVLPKKINIINPPIRENIAIDSDIATIIATDNDEPCTERTEIEYSIVKIEDEKGREDNELFKISSRQNDKPNCEQIGDLKVNKSLDGYYGKITITIHAQSPYIKEHYDTKEYEIDVKRYNFKPPKFKYPTNEESSLILQLDQTADNQLIRIDGSTLKDFEATDDQNGKYEMFFETGKVWDPVFQLNSKPNGEKNKARLTVTDDKPSKKEYELQIKAYHEDGEGIASSSVEQTIIVKFIDKNQLPVFKESQLQQQVAFCEGPTDKICEPFSGAEDPKCYIDENINCTFITYYHIMNAEEKVNFEIKIDDNKIPQVCLKQMLDREEQPYRYLTIIATNLPTAPPYIPENYEALNLTVRVIDINDNPPEFVSKLFKGGLSDKHEIDSTIVTLNATDPDTVDEGKLWYHIVENSINVSDTSLESVKNNMFRIEKDMIKNSLQPTQQMKGYFHFHVQVFDTLNFSDTAEVKINIISDANQVLFKFSENIDTVRDKKNEIESIFTTSIKYSCTVDDFAKKSNETTKTKSNTRASDYVTEVKTHFVDENDETVPKEKISSILLDDDLSVVGKLKYRFEEIGLTLEFIEDPAGKIEDNMEYLYFILLIVVSVALGVLCIILIVAFILRTRSLQKRLEAMTTNVFGSTKSDLNRIGTSAPGTNRHAIEANPVWNEDLNSANQYDTMSQASDGSDLIGVEDRPDFEYGFHRASINPIIQQRLSEQSDGDINIHTGFSNVKKISRDDDYDDDDISSLPGSIRNNERF